MLKNIVADTHVFKIVTIRVRAYWSVLADFRSKNHSIAVKTYTMPSCNTKGKYMYYFMCKALASASVISIFYVGLTYFYIY